LSESGQLNRCASLLHRGHQAYDPARRAEALHVLNLKEAQLNYAACAGIRYLLVLRTLAFVAPSSPKPATRPFMAITSLEEDNPNFDSEIDPQLASSHSYLTFAGGHLRAEVLVFDLETRRLVGGARFTVESSLKIQGDETAVADDFQIKLRKSLYTAVDALPNRGGS
jgi:hypothetical protein